MSRIWRRRRGALVFTVLLVLGISLYGCGDSGGQDRPSWGGGGQRPGNWPGGGSEAPEAVSIKAARVEQKPISTFLLSNTSLESVRKVTIFTKVNALVNQILVEEGDFVGKDQIIARLDDREIRNEFTQAEIAVDQAELAVKQAEVKASLSESNHARSKTLFEQKLISQQEFDQTELTNRTDALAFQVAREQLSAAKARLEAARIQLEYTDVGSSIDGVVTERLIDVGTRVNVNQAVFTVEDPTPLWARIYVPERELAQLRIGQVAQLTVQAFPNERFRGFIKMISPTVDAESGTVKITVEVNEARGFLRPGMFGTVSIATQTRENAVVMPKKAVIRERDENRVFVVTAENVVEKREVQLGFSQEDLVEVVSGVQPGDVVVTVGQEGLNDGYPVNVLAWEDGGTVVPPPTQVSPPQPQQAESPGGPPRASAEDGRPRQGPGGFGGPGRGSPEQMKMFLERMLSNPEVKKAYDERLKENPNLADDPEALRSFLREMRQKMGRGQ